MAHVFRDHLFAGKHVFVTGGSSGINLRIAQEFGRAGAKVAINGRKVDKLEAAVEALKQQGITASGHAADVREYAAINGALNRAWEMHGDIDVLVCGAAGNFPAPAIGMSANAFKSVIDIDVLGTYHACRAAFERLKKPGACILNITAPQGAIPFAMQSHVCAAKAGVDMITRTLALEWGQAGVRVNAISPGPITETEGMERLAGEPGMMKKLESVMPIGRCGTRDDVAQAALFLASDAASFITGSILSVDGGQTLLGGGLLFQAISS
jgi:NAD(P)-dependent dehydrogenase (short-subunit alcohol dehydrogenase family)